MTLRKHRAQRFLLLWSYKTNFNFDKLWVKSCYVKDTDGNFFFSKLTNNEYSRQCPKWSSLGYRHFTFGVEQIATGRMRLPSKAPITVATIWLFTVGDLAVITATNWKVDESITDGNQNASFLLLTLNSIIGLPIWSELDFPVKTS